MRLKPVAKRRARGMRREPTPAEARIWRWLRSRRFCECKFRRQHPVGGAILDFYSPALRLAIELDGRQHSTPWVAARDGARDLRLASLGIEVLRIPNEMIVRDAVSVETWLEARIIERVAELSR